MGLLNINRRAAGRLVRVALAAWAALLSGLPAAAGAATARCDRECLRGVADTLLASMVAHEAGRLQLAHDYRATENFVPSVPAMMASWREVSSVRTPFYVIDPTTQQVFFVATILEGGQTDLLYGRLRAPEAQITELELYVNRSRGQSGYMFDPEGPARLGAAWTDPIPADRRPSRAALLAAGRSMFDTRAPAPPAAAACTVIETGQRAQLSRTMQMTVTDADKDAAPHPALGEKTVPVSCAAVAHRPIDLQARADIVDEMQGIVVGIAVVRGTASAYLLGAAPESNFLPEDYYARYQALRDENRKTSYSTAPVLAPMKTSAGVVQIYRIFDGRIQGFQRFIQVLPAGSVSPWTQ